MSPRVTWVLLAVLVLLEGSSWWSTLSTNGVRRANLSVEELAASLYRRDATRAALSNLPGLASTIVERMTRPPSLQAYAAQLESTPNPCGQAHVAVLWLRMQEQGLLSRETARSRLQQLRVDAVEWLTPLFPWVLRDLSSMRLNSEPPCETDWLLTQRKRWTAEQMGREADSRAIARRLGRDGRTRAIALVGLCIGALGLIAAGAVSGVLGNRARSDLERVQPPWGGADALGAFVRVQVATMVLGLVAATAFAMTGQMSSTAGGLSLLAGTLGGGTVLAVLLKRASATPVVGLLLCRRGGAWSVVHWSLRALACVLFVRIAVGLVFAPESQIPWLPLPGIGVEFSDAVLATPIVEELLYRWILYSAIRLRTGPSAAALLSAIVFGLEHTGVAMNHLAMLILVGLILAIVYERSKLLAPAMIAHSLDNAFELARIHLTV